MRHIYIFRAIVKDIFHTLLKLTMVTSKTKTNCDYFQLKKINLLYYFVNLFDYNSLIPLSIYRFYDNSLDTFNYLL